VADLNGDHQLDVVVGNIVTHSVTVYLGGGDGSLAKAADYATSANERLVALGDVNGDGRLDLVGLDANTLSTPVVDVLLGNGDGTFQAAKQTTVPSTCDANDLAVADLTGDGRADVVVVDACGLTPLIASSTGSLAIEAHITAGPTTVGVAAADLDGDHRVDLAVASQGDVGLRLYHGNGDGTFAPPRLYTSGDTAGKVAVGDVDGDGKVDVVFSAGGIGVALGRGDGTVHAAPMLLGGQEPAFVAVGDLNGDGNADVIVGNAGSDDIDVFLGHGDGTFGAPSAFPAGMSVSAVAVGDLDGDGKQDVVASTSGTPSLAVLFGHGDGTVAAPKAYVGEGGRRVVLADFNGDKRLDVVFDDVAAARVMLNKGSGALAPSVAYAADTNTYDLLVLDADGDGVMDIATANYDANDVSFLRGKGDGTFAAALNLPVGTSPGAIAAADFNGDTKLDLATGNTGTSDVSVLLGHGDGTFAAAVSQAANTHYPDGLYAADFDRDTHTDLFVVGNGGGEIVVRRGNGDATFGAALPFFTPFSTAAAITDLNHDALPDAVVVTSLAGQQGYVSVMVNTSH
jgi:hypothetical protein